ncbi:cysteine hydrolase [Streptomyces sp. WAC04770]|nr:cysteine hydrolase [Streptomyces sp. WAC04770]RST23215.1 cysteine hydrolase [Streptomyces sp. WAC04770]
MSAPDGSVLVVHVRFLGDVRFQGRAWLQRDEALGKRPKCLEGSCGAESAAGVEPRPSEAVFTKRACFDAFLGDGFERRLVGRGVQRLLSAGLFAEICVDSTARTASQKGFEATVLRDCTTGLHLPDEQILSLMNRLYGARIATGDLAEVWSSRPGEREPRPSGYGSAVAHQEVPG